MEDPTVFAWDPRKAEANEQKHGVDFNEATSAFLDPWALVIPDPQHAVGEDRFVLLGLSLRFRALVVCHCYPEDSHVIRIISARKASPGEVAQYLARAGGVGEGA